MIVVKVGGSAGINYDLVCDDIAALVKEGNQVILVHGGSHETNVISEKLGKPPRILTSPQGYTSRYTDAETMDIFAMVYAGKMNTRIVERLLKRGIEAIGLSGLDGRLLVGPRKTSVRAVENGRQILVRDDYTGKVESVNTALLNLLLGAGYTPVITPPACSTQGEAINVDGDRAAAMIASAVGARQLIILSNVPGLLRQFPDESTLIPALKHAELEQALSFAEGRMKKKVLGASEAIAGGVEQVIFADARIPQPVRMALAGKGTVISK
ncbi:MAG: [LysW]-aminoadipate kinase [Chloroflexi bacterium]|nr:[LysW]-aminoadipate kinase [Chloroflexota bacterium]MCL5274205.1 [LysW]-aminoadipate kinase [Chloroflexota bacterium]